MYTPGNRFDPLPRSLTELRAVFGSLPADGELTGDYRAEFIGPRPLHTAAPRAIALGGMPRWHGKRFAGDGTAVNLLRASAAADAPLLERLPMGVDTEPSWLDGQPAIVVSYGADGPIPWRWVRDEFRFLDARTLLGLTFAGGRWSRRAAAPFLLIRES
ncbi:hypothetical protein [Nocardia sp. X0981]